MKPPKKILDEFEKIAKEAFAEGSYPALALRYYAPESILADVDGWVDLMVRTVADDHARESDYQGSEALITDLQRELQRRS